MTTLVGVRRGSSGQVGAGSGVGGIAGVPTPQFYLQLSDSGSGAVNTGASIGGAATFTRATTAWTKLSTGLWASVATGVARSCYLGADTTVGTYGGYLSEASATQLVTPTASIRDMTNAAWVKVTMTTAFTSTGIGGAANSCTRCTASGANATILQTLVAAASSRTYSCWIKRITGTGEIDISEDGSTWTNITAQINSSTFTRVSVTVSQLNAAFGLRIVTNGDAIDVDFNQFEAGPFATSPMDSAGGARADDFLTYPSGSLLTASGSCYAEYSLNGLTGALVQFVAGTDLNGRLLESDAISATQIRVYDGTNVLQSGAGTSSIGKVVKAISSWGGTTESCIQQGGSISIGAFDGTISVASPLGIGGRGDTAGNILYGTVRNVRLWASQLPIATMQRLTS